MRNFFKFFTFSIFTVCLIQKANSQDLHFSQYYNAPMLLNPANTALMPDHDFRFGANFRNQWASVPVPYRTISAYADFQLLHSEERNNWLGLGLAFFNDKAGNGDLSLSRFEGFVAYHLQLGTNSMISAGLSGGYVQRSVDLDKLTFDSQWDGFSFNNTLANNEKPGIAKTKFFDLGAGVNFAYFPNDNVYIKLGVGVSHINTPKESFYNITNTVGRRPSANLDGFFRLNSYFIVNPSVYYSNLRSASELVYGSLFQYWLGGEGNKSNQLLVGIYHRWNEAIIPVVGFDWGNLRLMCSYDITASQFSTTDKSNGAFEIALRYQGVYGGGGRPHNLYNCPRF